MLANKELDGISSEPYEFQWFHIEYHPLVCSHVVNDLQLDIQSILSGRYCCYLLLDGLRLAVSRCFDHHHIISILGIRAYFSE